MTDEIVKELAAHRKTEDRTAPRDIIVSFTTHNVKKAVMRNGRKLKGTRVHQRRPDEDPWEDRLGNPKSPPRARDGKLTETWTRDGIVFVKTVDNLSKSFTATNAWKAFVDKR